MREAEGHTCIGHAGSPQPGRFDVNGDGYYLEDAAFRLGDRRPRRLHKEAALCVQRIDAPYQSAAGGIIARGWRGDRPEFHGAPPCWRRVPLGVPQPLTACPGVARYHDAETLAVTLVKALAARRGRCEPVRPPRGAPSRSRSPSTRCRPTCLSNARPPTWFTGTAPSGAWRVPGRWRGWPHLVQPSGAGAQ